MSRKSKRPRRVIIGSNSQKDLGALSNSSPSYYGQQLDFKSQQDDLLGRLTGLGSGLPTTIGTNPIGGTGSSSNKGNVPNLPHGFAAGSNYYDMLTGALGNSSLIQLLQGLGNDYGKGLTSAQANDWNKQLLDLILQQYANQEQRSYDRSVLDEQRTYDNPLNQLARLMGAGISRDAAIQMLSGSGSGSGAGSALIGSMAGQVSTGIAPSESYANQVSSATNIANSVFGGISAISGLVSLGFSVPQAIQQTRYLQNQNSLTQRQLAAYDSTGRAYSILQAAGASAEAFGSVSSASAAITDLAKGGNADAIKFIQSGGLASMQENANFASQAFRSLYGSERASQDYATMFTAEVANMDADTDLKKVNKDNLSYQIHLFDAQIAELQSSAQYQDEMTILTRWQQRLVGHEISKTDAETKFIGSQTLSQDLANNLQQSWQSSVLDDGRSAVDWYTDKVNNELYIQVKSLSYQKDSELWKKQVDTMLADQKQLTALYTLKTLYYDGSISSYNDGSDEYKDLVSFCNVCNETGVFDYIDTVIDAESSGNIRIGPLGSSTPLEHPREIIQTIVDSHEDQRPSWKQRWNNWVRSRKNK